MYNIRRIVPLASAANQPAHATPLHKCRDLMPNLGSQLSIKRASGKRLRIFMIDMPQ